MAQNEESRLPDLKQTGIPVDEVKDGVLSHGQVGGDPVILTRTDGEVHAVGSRCTHYGGPLEKGLAVDGTVRCPWHHACFSLATGEALRAPALDPLPCYRVEERDGRYYITEKKERGPLEPTAYDRAARQREPDGIVIIGAGAAGSAAAEMLRRCDYQGRITMVDVEKEAPYDRPNLSKDYLAGDAPEDWLPLRGPDFYGKHGIEVVRSRVSALDADARTVKLEDGTSLTGEALLLATGSEPRHLDVPGTDLSHVFTLRSRHDSEAIIARAENAENAVVIGASFIGLEVAASLRQRGLNVTVAAPEDVPLERVFGKDVGGMIQEIHEEQGVSFRLGAGVKAISETGITLESGEELPADLVVVGIGVKPRTALAEEAGLEVDGGVIVNEYLETTAPGIYAAGDIARWPSAQTGSRVRVEHWVVAQRHGQAAARNMLGAGEPFRAVPYFWSKHYGLSIRYSGHAEDWDDIAISGSVSDREFSAAYRKDGKVLAVASAGRDLENLKAAVALEADDQVELTELF